MSGEVVCEYCGSNRGHYVECPLSGILPRDGGTGSVALEPTQAVIEKRQGERK